MIHSDVWGSFYVPTCFVKRWFITFIDDHTRLTWVCLLKEKFGAKQVFKNFHNMIKTQFQANLKVFRSDNGREYFNHILGKYFVDNGIVQQSSRSDTPQ